MASTLNHRRRDDEAGRRRPSRAIARRRRTTASTSSASSSSRRSDARRRPDVDWPTDRPSTLPGAARRCPPPEPGASTLASNGGRRGQADHPSRTARRRAVPGAHAGSVPRDGAAHLRARERVRRHLHAARPAPAQPRRGRPLPVPPGRVVGPQLATSSSPTAPGSTSTSARHPEYATPECDSIHDLVVHDKAGERILEQLLASRRAAPPGGGHPRRHLPVQEQHRLGRQLLRLPRELPDQPARRLRPLRRGAHPVPRSAARSTPAPARCCRPPGARCSASASGPSTSGRASRQRHHPQPARSSTPATSPTPTPSATAAST